MGYELLSYLGRKGTKKNRKRRWNFAFLWNIFNHIAFWALFIGLGCLFSFYFFCFIFPSPFYLTLYSSASFCEGYLVVTVFGGAKRQKRKEKREIWMVEDTFLSKSYNRFHKDKQCSFASFWQLPKSGLAVVKSPFDNCQKSLRQLPKDSKEGFFDWLRGYLGLVLKALMKV